MENLSSTEWVIIAGMVFGVFLMARERAARRSLEATVRASQKAPTHQDTQLEDTPRRLQRHVAQVWPDMERLGFNHLLTGARLTLAEGRTDSHYHVAVSPDKTTVAEMNHIRVGWNLGILWPAQLPLSQWFGPVEVSTTLETFFTDRTTLITTTNQGVAEVALPSWVVLPVPPATPFEQMWNWHRAKLEQLIAEEGRTVVPFKEAAAYFEKERLQREETNKALTRLIEEALGVTLEPDPDREQGS
jgi:hypothetical protein